ncbi:MAG TPA: hypothetical protein VI408_06590 [Gaiellaceae bacterium]
MRGLRTTAATAVLLLALAAAVAQHARPAALPCVRSASAAYTSYVRSAVASTSDVWGRELLRQRGGPTYASARRFLTPLTRGVQWQRHPLTQTGSYYLALAFPFTPYGSTVFALHAADGSEIVTRRAGGASLVVYVGNGRELYGSCTTRLQPPRLADGYLPILQTSYVDAGGAHYRQESFVGRSYGAYGARSVISFVKLAVDTRGAKRAATIRLVPWKRLAHTQPDRFATRDQTRLIVSDGGDFVQGVVRYTIPPGETRTIYALWLNAPSDAQYVHATKQTYDVARRTVVAFWQKRLAQGATYEVPEPAVQNAELAILTQLISYGWRYSIGNPYEELSYAESLDAAEVAAEYGYADVARQIIDFSLERMRIRPWRFTAFRGARILTAAATYYRLTRDHDFLRAENTGLVNLVSRIRHRQLRDGSLMPEPLSTDLEDKNVESISGQIAAVQGLLAISRVWSSVGDSSEAEQARTLALSIDAKLHRIVARSSKRLKDGSLFVPAAVGQKPFGRITATRDGSYWNLVMPYAFASGWFPAHSRTSRGILRYLFQHGSRMLGVPRTYARTVYGNEPGAGLAQVYGLSMSRFLADNDEPDQLVLSLYGMLAAGMTENTFVSGEAVSVLPVDGAYDRTMFMPPNSGANASFLETLRQVLVHERRGPRGGPVGLDLAFSTPRAWLANGQQITVTSAPTSFGRVSYTLTRRGSEITAHLVLPPHGDTRLRLRVPAGERVVSAYAAGKTFRADSAGTVDLGALHGSFALSARVE